MANQPLTENEKSSGRTLDKRVANGYPIGCRAFHVVCSLNNYAVGLTMIDGLTMTAKEESYFLGEQPSSFLQFMQGAQ